MNSVMSWPDRLKQARGSKSRKSVADALGISYSAMQMYECGCRRPRDEIKQKLAKYYGTSVDELFF